MYKIESGKLSTEQFGSKNKCVRGFELILYFLIFSSQ